MSRRKTWDTEDPNRLRRSVLSSDAHLDDKYYTRFISPASMNPSGSATLTHLNSVWPTLSMPTGATSTGAGVVEWPEHWRYGRLTTRQYWRHNNAAGSTSFVPETLVEGQAVGEPAGRSTIITLKQQIVALGSGGSLNQVVVFEWESTSVEEKLRSSGEQELLGVRVRRAGTNGNDNMAGTMYFLGVKLIWKPEPR